MRLIKNKKLFGVFNLLDAAIVLSVVILSLPILRFYIGYNEQGIIQQKVLERYLERKKMTVRAPEDETPGGDTGSVEFYASFKNLTKKDVSRLKVGDKEISPDGRVLAEILWLGQPEPNYYFDDYLALERTKYMRAFSNDGHYAIPAKLRVYGVIMPHGVFNYKNENVSNFLRLEFNSGSYSYRFEVEMFPFLNEQVRANEGL